MDTVQEVEGLRRKSTVFHKNDGYFYSKSSVDAYRVYLKCHRSSCNARAFMPVHPEMRTAASLKLKRRHNHLPDDNYLAVAKLRRAIIRRCTMDNTSSLRKIFDELCQGVDKEVASQLDLASMTSSMKRARKMATSKEVEVLVSSGPPNVESGPCASTSNMQFKAPLISPQQQDGTSETETSQSSCAVPAPSPTAEENSVQSQNVVDIDTMEMQPRTITLDDIMRTIDTPSSSDNSSGVKTMKQIKSSQSKRKNEKEVQSTNKDDIESSNVDISVKTLESAIHRLESVSNRLVSVSLVDSYDQFGKYISTVLRGLPIKKVYSLKQKILLEVMEVVSQEESRSSKRVSKDSQENVSSEIRSNFKRILAEHPQGTIPGPKCLRSKISMCENMPIHISSISTASNPVMTSQVTPSATACRESHEDLSFTSAISDTTSLPHSGEAALKIEGGSYTSTTISSPMMDQSPSQYRSGRKRRRSPANHLTNQEPPAFGTITLSLTTSIDDSSADQPPNSSILEREAEGESDFPMDITEGDELARIKEDEGIFETVLCDGSSNLFIKEEAPDPDPEEDNLLPFNAPTTPLVTCNLCNTECTSRDELVIHFATAHPGYAAGCKDVYGSDYFGT